MWTAAIALVVLVVALAQAPRAEASKVTMDNESIRKGAVQEPCAPEKSITAGVSSDERPQPALAPAPRHEPVKYDALPERERRKHTLHESLAAFAEV
jgi:hypothetical protein